MAKALLVIDLQKDYVEKYPSLLLACVNERIHRAAAGKELIVYVKNTKRLRSGKMTSELTEKLSVCSDYIICKESASAFSNPVLLDILKQNQIAEIEIAGIDGNSCVASTALDSAQYGYSTILRLECVGTQNAKRFEKTKALLLVKGIIIK